MSIFQKMNTRRFYGKSRQQNSNDRDNESVDSPEHSDLLDDSSYEEDSLASDSDSSSNSDDGSDTEIIGETEDTNNEGNETHNEDDMDGIDVQADQESGPAQIESEWNDTVTAVPRAFPFTGKEELLVQPADTRQVWPIDIFELFVTDEVVDYIVAETNRYASQVIDSQTVTRKSRLNVWRPTDRAEMRKFLGIVMLMGICPLPKISLYWSKCQLYQEKLIPDSMDRDRCQMLMRMLHFCDNEDPNTSRMRKVQFLLDMLITNYQRTYKPGSCLVVDESMVPFRGRVVFRQYIPGKSHKYGCKQFKLCTLDGYTWNLEVYSGTSVSENSMGLSDSVVVCLTRDLMDIGATIFMDNYYTSIPLAKFLLSRKTYLCGTARANWKHIPTRVIKKNLKRGEIAAADCIRQENSQRRRGKKTKSVLDYNVAKKGVDLSDQMSSYYSALKKNNKLYKKIAMELLTGCSVVNAWVLFNKYHCRGKKWSILAFRESIILSLLTNSPEEQLRPGRRSATSDVSSSQPVRSSHSLAEAEGPKRKSRKCCVGCYEMISINEGSREASKRAKKVSTYCKSCDVNPFLRISCFETKHTVK